jgi:hypothetical protein
MSARVPWLLLLGCMACVPLSDPCPSGSTLDPVEQHCVLELSDAALPAGESGDAQVPEAGALDGRAALDDAGAHDASAADARDASSDGPHDTEPDAGPLCSIADVDRWTRFHLETDPRETFTQCGLSSNTTDFTEAAECVRMHLFMTDCTACTELEARCVAASCASACGSPGKQGECRSCACEAGCVDLAARCAGRPMPVCDDVYGRDATNAELDARLPVMFRMKRNTGYVGAGPLVGAPDEANSKILGKDITDLTVPLHQHWSTGFAGLLGVSVDGRSFVLQYKAQCGDNPCIARISPLLSDATLGRPAYLAHWDEGWDLVEAFQVGSHAYLLRYKSGSAATSGDTKGTLLVEQLVWDETMRTITLRQVLKRAETRPQDGAWSRVEAFAHAGETYLFFFGLARNGEARISRVSEQGTGLTIEPASQLAPLKGGWDMFETFAVGTRWFLLSYKSGRAPILGDAAGTVRVQGFVSDQHNVALGVVLHQSIWPSGLTRLIGYQNGSQAYLFRQDSILRNIDLLRLSDPASFGSALGSIVVTSTWGISPAWDITEVVGNKPW